jgi:hypothetical protein
MEKKEIYFEVGMEVWDVVYGNATVLRINEDVGYPVVVRFNNTLDGYYTFDGRREKGLLPVSLFQTKPIITPNVPLVSFEKGELVLCRESKNGVLGMRYFSHKDEEGFWCFDMQLKDGNVSYWHEIRKLNDNPLIEL